MSKTQATFNSANILTWLRTAVNLHGLV